MRIRTVARWNGVVIAIGGIPIVVIGIWGLTKTPISAAYILMGIIQFLAGIAIHRWGKRP